MMREPVARLIDIFEFIGDLCALKRFVGKRLLQCGAPQGLLIVGAVKAFPEVQGRFRNDFAVGNGNLDAADQRRA